MAIVKPIATQIGTIKVRTHSYMKQKCRYIHTNFRMLSLHYFRCIDKIRLCLHFQNIKINTGSKSGVKCQHNQNKMGGCVRLPLNTIWRLCSRRLFENIVTKEEIAQNVQFLLLTQCFPLLVIGYPFNYRDFLFFYKISSKSSAAELSYEGKG